VLGFVFDLRSRARVRTDRKLRRAAIRAYARRLLGPIEAAYIRGATAAVRHPVRVLLLFLVLILVALVIAACGGNLSVYAATRAVWTIGAATTLGIAAVTGRSGGRRRLPRASGARARAWS
jgi:hypothetical protein